jgi:hypothetical protein
MGYLHLVSWQSPASQLRRTWLLLQSRCQIFKAEGLDFYDNTYLDYHGTNTASTFRENHDPASVTMNPQKIAFQAVEAVIGIAAASSHERWSGARTRIPSLTVIYFDKVSYGPAACHRHEIGDASSL